MLRIATGARGTGAGSYGSAGVTPRPAHARMSWRYRSRRQPPGCPYMRAFGRVSACAPRVRHPDQSAPVDSPEGAVPGTPPEAPAPGAPAPAPPAPPPKNPCPRSYAARPAAVPTSSHARCTAMNATASPPVSGCVARRRRRYARFSASSSASGAVPSTSYADAESGLSNTPCLPNHAPCVRLSGYPSAGDLSLKNPLA
mgnify:CR=1 FL=1